MTAERDSHLADTFCGAEVRFPEGQSQPSALALQWCVRYQLLPLGAVGASVPCTWLLVGTLLLLSASLLTCQSQPDLGFGAVSSFLAVYLFTRIMILKITMTQGHRAWTETDESVQPIRGSVLLFRAQVLLADRCGLEFWLFCCCFSFWFWADLQADSFLSELPGKPL